MILRKAVIPAAGLGTRFLSATKVVPKELLPIVDRPALEYIVEELLESGIQEVILVISPGKEIIFDHFTLGGTLEEILVKRGQISLLSRLERLIKQIKFRKVYQHEALGLGHAVLCAKEVVGREPFAVVLPDDLVKARKPCLAQLLSAFKTESISTIALEKVPKDQVHCYGIVGGNFSEESNYFRLNTIVEKPSLDKAPSQWAIIGRYVLTPTIFDLLEQTPPGKIGEIQLTDALAKLAEIEGVIGIPFEGKRIDIGQPVGFVEANLLFAMEHLEAKKALAPVIEQFTRLK